MINKDNFRLKKDGTCRKQCYCAHPELIENYDLAIKDKKRIWICHHKKEEFYARQELIDLGIYYKVPPEDLVFVKDEKEHKSWPHKGNDLRKGKPHPWSHKPLSEETKRKMSKNRTDKIKVQCVETGQVFESLKAVTKFVGLKDNNSIRVALKNPKRTAGGYHWRHAL